MVSTKKIKVIRFTMRHALKDAEEIVNKEIDDLVRQGKKIISITPFVVPTTTFYIIYNIIYEEQLPESGEKALERGAQERSLDSIIEEKSH